MYTNVLSSFWLWRYGKHPSLNNKHSWLKNMCTGDKAFLTNGNNNICVKHQGFGNISLPMIFVFYGYFIQR